jgi:predicted SnoaL-like aldol condensation-catalyzing enzyme
MSSPAETSTRDGGGAGVLGRVGQRLADHVVRSDLDPVRQPACGFSRALHVEAFHQALATTRQASTPPRNLAASVTLLSRPTIEWSTQIMGTQENKQAAARLFEGFRTGDLSVVDDLFVDDYVQHNPQAPDGRAATKALFAEFGPLDLTVYRIFGEGNWVFVHSSNATWNMANADVFLFNEAGKIVEHWDVLQSLPGTTVSGHDMLSQITPGPQLT